MTEYTTPWGLPKPGPQNYIAGSTDSLRFSIGALADKTNQQLTQAAQPVLDLLAEHPVRFRGTLDAEQSIDELTSPSWNGIWTIGSANTNPALPNPVGVAGRLLVLNTTNDRYHRVDWRNNGGSYERTFQLTTVSAWHRIDNIFSYHGPPAEEITALHELTHRAQTGIWRIHENREFSDIPDEAHPGWEAGMLVNFTDGQSTTFQILSLNNQGDTPPTYFRTQKGSSGNFTDWTRWGATQEGDTNNLLRRSVEPKTYWEVSQSFDFTSYDDGEHYMDWLALQHPNTLEILTLGQSHEGRDIRAFQIGDPTLPTLYIICGQHGDEVMSRETVYLWVRDLLTRWAPNLLSTLCLVVTPTVNVDRITQTRVTARGTDLNRNWATRTAPEVQAAASVLHTHDVVLMIDAHEGGKFTHMQGLGPTSPNVSPAIREQADTLHNALQAAFDEAGSKFPYETYPSPDPDGDVRNTVAITEGITTYLFESPSLLGAEKWSPEPPWRHQLYLLAYETVLQHVTEHLEDYVNAKSQAQ